MQGGEIPGIHRRRCTSCGRSVFMTEQTSRLERRGRRIETWSGRCDGCAAAVTYAIPTGSTQPTLRDATDVGQLAQAVREAVRRRMRARRDRADASNV